MRLLVEQMKVAAIVLLGGLGTLSKVAISASLQDCAQSVVSTWKGK
jgi:ABC-type branched-subunit amino acid transport system permease subunit